MIADVEVPIAGMPMTARSLMQSAEFWQSIADGVPDMLLLVDEQGHILYVNRPPSGMRREDALGRSVFDFVPTASRAELRGSLEDIFQRGAPARQREQPGVHSDGTTHWYTTHTGPIVRDGRVVAAAVSARDITESKRAQIALADSEARCRTLVEHAPEAIVVFDLDRRTFVDANQNACTLFGLPLEHLLQSDPVTLSPQIQPSGVPSMIAVQRNLDDALAGKIPSFEWMHRTSTGRDVLCEVRLARLPSSERRLVRGSIIDVTERRRSEQQMQDWQKMDALGQLAAGIAHDFNNLLCVITAAANMINDTPNLGVDVREDASAILTAAERGAALTMQLLTFARRQASATEIVDLNDIVGEMVMTLRRVIDRRIQIVEHLNAETARVAVSRSQLEQVVMNLVLNSRDAIPLTGSITVSTSQQDSQLFLRVTDTGTGMSNATRRRVLEPFFTTKAQSGGSGLGLSMVRTIVAKAGGTINIDSALGAGTCIEIMLPMARTD